MTTIELQQSNSPHDTFIVTSKDKVRTKSQLAVTLGVRKFHTKRSRPEHPGTETPRTFCRLFIYMGDLSAPGSPGSYLAGAVSESATDIGLDPDRKKYRNVHRCCRIAVRGRFGRLCLSGLSLHLSLCYKGLGDGEIAKVYHVSFS
ncbi:hypothetical protein Bbelb_093570 [Branchiostoma belcheri]|nr:hypothetical protein Bbelb_093570 [Branchiostoma belcheri]